MRPIILLLVFAPATALAFGGKPHVPGNPHLAIQPAVLASNGFRPTPENDRDADCLDDAAEHAIAQHFRPYFIFDSRENARRSFEPVVVYRVWPTPRARCGGALPTEVSIKYAHLYRDDGGFATSTLCGNTHRGDNQSILVRVRVESGGRVFRMTSVVIGGEYWPNSRVYFHGNHHPAVYLSAGKHHEYVDTAWDGAGYPYYNLGCREGVDGAGPRLLARLESAYAPRGRNNVGEPGAHPSAWFVNDLRWLGFEGESAWGTTPFCGGHRSSCDPDDTSTMAGLWGN